MELVQCTLDCKTEVCTGDKSSSGGKGDDRRGTFAKVPRLGQWTAAYSLHPGAVRHHQWESSASRQLPIVGATSRAPGRMVFSVTSSALQLEEPSGRLHKIPYKHQKELSHDGLQWNF
eukprot:6374783-Amphidinium_carterae.1